MYDISNLRRRLGVSEVEKAIDTPRELWANRCHEVSLQLLKSHLFEDVDARMARGWGMQIRGQHSWIVLGDNVYDDETYVIDPTWSATHSNKAMIMFVKNLTVHRPHGYGVLSTFPESSGGDELVPDDPSPSVKSWLDLARIVVGPLDRKFWLGLFNGPMQGWPSRELVAWGYGQEGLRALIPMDIVGMLTEENPMGLYLRD